MSSIEGTFGSPPYFYTMADGRQITFKRMMGDEWETLTTEIRKELLERENTVINKQVPANDLEQRYRARFIAEEQVGKMTAFREVVRHVTMDIKGIQRLLNFCVVDAEWESVRKLIPPTDMDMIAEKLVYLPVVKIENPPSPGGEQDTSDTAGQSTIPTPTGNESGESSDTPSTSNQAA
jgi:hypothetical protein